MPIEGQPHTAAEVAAVRAWIDDGAHWDSGPAEADPLALTELGLPADARDYSAFQLPVKAEMPEGVIYRISYSR
jgi:hypothetical protein